MKYDSLKSRVDRRLYKWRKNAKKSVTHPNGQASGSSVTLASRVSPGPASSRAADVMEIGGIQFVVMTRNTDDLEKLQALLLPEAQEPFNAEKCQKSILVQASILPEKP